MQAVDGGNLESSGMSSNQWHGLTSHLSRAHAAFFAHWVGLVDMEEAGSRCVCCVCACVRVCTCMCVRMCTCMCVLVCTCNCV